MYNNDNIKMVESKNIITPGIYVVSTPIGNRYDITIRAIRLLKKADIMLCENIRITKNLFYLLDLETDNKKWVSYNDYHSVKNFPFILEGFNKNKIICLVSDAGTPLISDPGYKLLKFAEENNIHVTTIPGPSSVISALSISNVKTDQFAFIGFLPKKKMDYIKKLRQFSDTNLTLIVFEKANRVNFLLNTMESEFSNFNITLAKELTKINEKVITINSDAIHNYLIKKKTYKGEFTIIIEFNEPLKKKKFSDKVLLNELKNMKPSQVSSMLSKNSSESREIIYKRCILLKKKYEKSS